MERKQDRPNLARPDRARGDPCRARGDVTVT